MRCARADGCAHVVATGRGKVPRQVKSNRPQPPPSTIWSRSSMSGCASSHVRTRACTDASVSAGVAGSLVRAVPPMVTYHIGGSPRGSASPDRVCPWLRAALICFPRYSRLTRSIPTSELWSIALNSSRGGPRTAECDIHGVTIRMDQRSQHSTGALLRMSGDAELSGSIDDLSAGQMIDRVAIFRPERVPQAAALVVRPQLRDLDAKDLGRRQQDVNPMSGLIDVDLRALVDVDSSQDFPSHDDQR